ncbi:MAG: ferric reductase protein [Enterovirga sp.]|nr:ferric reductase protein [Enterovirga sp.]
MTHPLALWRDRKGRLSWLRIATLAVLLWPVLLAGADTALGRLGPRPINDLIHRAGWWALAFLLASLAITPLRSAARFAKLIDIRRMVGVASFAYAFTHLVLYVVDLGFDLRKVATEILVRPYLTIGFAALLGLAALAATSTDTMVRTLGSTRWRLLHQLAFPVGLLTLIHFFQQTKADISVPTLYAGLFAWLVGYRLLSRATGRHTLSGSMLLALALAAATLTFLGEAFGIALAFGVPATAVLRSAFDLDLGLRPGWSILGAGLAVVLVDLVRNRTMIPRRTRSTPEKVPDGSQSVVRSA